MTPAKLVLFLCRDQLLHMIYKSKFTLSGCSVCVFSCNLPPALLAEWLSFTQYCGGTGVEQILKQKSGQKANSGEENSSATSTGDQTHCTTFPPCSSWCQCCQHWGKPGVGGGGAGGGGVLMDFSQHVPSCTHITLWSDKKLKRKEKKRKNTHQITEITWAHPFKV